MNESNLQSRQPSSSQTTPQTDIHARLSFRSDGVIVDVNELAARWFPTLTLGHSILSDAWLASQEIHLSDREFRTLHVDALMDGSYPDRYVGLASSELTRWVQWVIEKGDTNHLLMTDVTDLMEDLFDMQEQAIESNTQDFATRLFNRRHAMERLEQMHLYAKRYHSPFTVAMIDIDHFKRINDTFGHNYGDEVLVRLADVIKKGFRETDVCARFGGEEFLILMPETDTQDAILSLDRLRQQVSELKWEKMQRPVTISSGVIAWQPNKSIEQLIFLADQRLSTAKKAGRNQVCGDLI